MKEPALMLKNCLEQFNGCMITKFTSVTIQQVLINTLNNIDKCFLILADGVVIAPSDIKVDVTIGRNNNVDVYMFKSGRKIDELKFLER